MPVTKSQIDDNQKEKEKIIAYRERTRVQMEAEWREVRKRGVGTTRPERPPVRQPYQPNPCVYPKPQTAEIQIGERVRNQRRLFTHPDHKPSHHDDMESNTFFFNNFPEGCSTELLRWKFEAVGKVKDVFCPRKRDLKGKPFGFVRFDKGVDQEQILAELNNIWIGSFKMRAYIPRFKRQPLAVKTKSDGRRGTRERQAETRQTQSYPVYGRRREEGTTFAEAVAGRIMATQKEGGKSLGGEDIGFQSTTTETEWLQNSFTGYIKSEFDWKEVKEEINSECLGRLKVTSLGGNLVLIQSPNNKQVEKTLEELDEWTSFWFEWTRQWRYFDVNNQRVVWTKWIGVPLQAWSPRFFDSASAIMGMMLKIHQDTKEKIRLDEAYVQISTGLQSLDRILNCKIDGAHFRIKVEEVKDSFNPETDLIKNTGVLEEDSEWSSEDEISDEFV